MEFLIISFVTWRLVTAAQLAKPTTQLIPSSTALHYILGGIFLFLIICPAILTFVFCKIIKNKQTPPPDEPTSDSENSDSKKPEV